jgi:hypothetical protein
MACEQEEPIIRGGSNFPLRSREKFTPAFDLCESNQAVVDDAFPRRVVEIGLSIVDDKWRTRLCIDLSDAETSTAVDLAACVIFDIGIDHQIDSALHCPQLNPRDEESLA